MATSRGWWRHWRRPKRKDRIRTFEEVCSFDMTKMPRDRHSPTGRMQGSAARQHARIDLDKMSGAAGTGGPARRGSAEDHARSGRSNGVEEGWWQKRCARQPSFLLWSRLPLIGERAIYISRRMPPASCAKRNEAADDFLAVVSSRACSPRQSAIAMPARASSTRPSDAKAEARQNARVAAARACLLQPCPDYHPRQPDEQLHLRLPDHGAVGDQRAGAEQPASVDAAVVGATALRHRRRG